jgi:hypothetical protein
MEFACLPRAKPAVFGRKPSNHLKIFEDLCRLNRDEKAVQ